MLASLKLPFCFDATRLQADLETILPAEWVDHYNKGIYEGDWSGVALRSVGGAAMSRHPDRAASVRSSGHRMCR